MSARVHGASVALEIPRASRSVGSLIYLTLSVGRNPCRRCSNPYLEPEFVGSGYCSLVCILLDMDGPDEYDRAYAREMVSVLVERELASTKGTP